MVELVAKWMGKCTVCGLAMPPGTPIEWTKETGARHVSSEACAEALATPPVPDPPLRGPQPQTPDDFGRLKSLLLAQTWKFAKTMAHIPHWYTLRKNWAVDEDFVWTITEMRRVGYQHRFGGRVYLYVDVDDFQYWDCAASGQDESLWLSVMEIEPKTNHFRVAGINRAVRRPERGRQAR